MKPITYKNIDDIKLNMKLTHLFSGDECTFIRWDDTSEDICHLIDSEGDPYCVTSDYETVD